jgi:hypothetical protein
VDQDACGSDFGIAARLSGVSRIVGSTQFTLIFLSRSSAAMVSVIRMTALFDAAYLPGGARHYHDALVGRHFALGMLNQRREMTGMTVFVAVVPDGGYLRPASSR